MGQGIIHLDGNRLNNEASNLMIVSDGELREFYKLNHQKLSADYTRLVINSIRLKHKLKERDND